MTIVELKEYTRWLWLNIIKVFLTLIVINLSLSLLPLYRDDSDGSWPSVSGLKPKTDALTGCQYLATSNGGIIARRDVNGNHVGCIESNK